jgi:DNA polymerase-3 subunit delta
MANLYLFTGENAYAIREERRLWEKRFAEKHGPENLLRLDAGDVTYRTLLDEISVAPFLAEKRLVVVQGIPKFEKEQAEALPAMIHPSSLLLFCAPKPDKRLAAVKTLLAVAEVKEFPLLTGAKLAGWIAQFAAERGRTLAADAVGSLLRIVGEDQDMLSQELEKLCVSGSGAITKEAVETLAVASGEQEVWQLTNLLAAGNATSALRYARNLQQKGEDPYSLWAILLWMLRNVVSVQAVVAAGQRNPGAIASQAGVPFPSAKTLAPFVQSIAEQKLKRFLDWAVAADIALKTGDYKATADAPQELQGLIDVFIVKCAGLKT